MSGVSETASHRLPKLRDGHQILTQCSLELPSEIVQLR
jgi:hypothetical protein